VDPKNFYLGRIYDPAQHKATDQPMLYDPANLTTHAIITGMTGSGKTGLGIGMLEEAALKGIPAIIIDPKGDLTNLLLHFPDFNPSDFQPWLDPEAARREGKTLEQLAVDTAATWKKGLEGYGIGREEMLALKDSAQFSIFTPGSTSGQPVNVLSSFGAPDVPWEENRETLREKISSIVTALLGLIGLTDLDPLRSREHILVSNVIENAWSEGRSLDLTSLILEVQKPPFDRLGAFPLDAFFPEKERFELAMLLNNFLASPSFESWREGVPLDIGALQTTSDGKPRHNIFYIAHLSEGERMFFVTLLFAAIESWMRAQRGTSGLRMMVYFDEIMGYLPPVANPPSRTIMLRMLKQARAFGVGIVLSTQNPVDVDYKALSNAGTWLIGRLQTEQDKNRLLDGLRSASGASDINAIDKQISALDKRVFLMNNVNKATPQLFTTRWAMNYLAGPLMRSQIPALNRLAGGESAGKGSTASSTARLAGQKETIATTAPAETTPRGETLTSARPVVPSGIAEYFLPLDLSNGEAIEAARQPTGTRIKGIVYRPALIAQAEARYVNSRYRLDTSRQFTCVLDELESMDVEWDQFVWRSYKTDEVNDDPRPQAAFAPLPGWLSDSKRFSGLQRDFEDWVYRNGTLKLRANATLKVYAGPEVSTAEFRRLCSDAARDSMQAELDKIDATFDKRADTLKEKIRKQTNKVEELQREVSQRTAEEVGKGLETLVGLIGGRKRSLSSNLSKRRMTASAKADLDTAREDLDVLKKQLAELTDLIEKEKKPVQEKWARMVDDETEVPVNPTKSNIYIDFFGVAWVPYFQAEYADQTVEIPAFKKEIG
jgi:tetrahydromethanopterin S-methyltransferase subunit G